MITFAMDLVSLFENILQKLTY